MAPAANIEKADLMGILDAVVKQAEKFVERLKTKWQSPVNNEV